MESVAASINGETHVTISLTDSFVVAAQSGAEQIDVSLRVWELKTSSLRIVNLRIIEGEAL